MDDGDKAQDQRTPEETERLRDVAIKRMLDTSPQPHKAPKGKKPPAKRKSKKILAANRQTAVR